MLCSMVICFYFLYDMFEILFFLNTTFTAVFHAYTQQCCEDHAQEYKLIFKQLQTCSLSVSPVRLTSQEETSWIACNLELHVMNGQDWSVTE